MEDYILSFIILYIGIFVLILALYIFSCYAMYRIGRKFNIGSFGGYLVPIYNLYLLTQCARIPATYIFFIFIPLVGSIILSTMIYGKIAERLNKNYWLYGLGSTFLGIPVFILAFDKSHPTDVANNGIAQNDWNQPDSGSQGNPFIGSNVFLVGMGQSYMDSVIPIPVEGIIIGRDPSVANVIIDDPNVSKSHVRVSLNPHSNDRAIIEDLGSTNGTYICTLPNAQQWKPLFGQIEMTGEMNGRIRIGNDGEIFELKFLNHAL